MRAVIIASVWLLVLSVTAPASAAVPGQFIAKMYTEALGRASDPGGWQYYVGYFNQNGCTQPALKSAGKPFYLGAEYNNLGYDNVDKVLTAYRGVLRREPDAGGFNFWVNYLNQGNALTSLLDAMFDSGEFGGLVTAICAGDYGWGNTGAISIPTTGAGFQGGTAGQLQAVLNAAAPGSTVYLAQRGVVWADTKVVIPNGVTLATTGLPDHTRYARQGRIVRTTLFGDTLVEVRPGAQLISVWVSGQRPVVGFACCPPYTTNISVRSGFGASVSYSRTDTPAGFSTLVLNGAEGEPGTTCSNVTISGNLSVGYGSNHFNGQWADGISNKCEGATITGNQIIDATDVGIVLFRATPATQQSQVTSNTIVAAGLSAYAAISLDPLAGGPTANFSGSLVASNQLWTAPLTHFDIGIAVGTMPWFANVGGVNGSGANVQNNSTANIITNFDSAMIIDGMINATVVYNDLPRNNVEVSACPTGGVLADVAGGHASGILQQWSQATAHSCIGH